MWRSKKFIVIAIPILATILLVGSIGGVALAQTEDESDSQPESRYGTLLNKVCEIYQEKTGDVIDQEVLEDAFAQASGEMRSEALESRLQSLVDQGQITQDEANQYQ